VAKDPNQKDLRDGPAGRVTFDKHGNAVWQPFTEVNTDETLINLLRIDELSVDDADASLTGFSPYGSGQGRKEKRRTIDDMRKLSEQIKTERHKKDGDG
jgi:hypothetical protein